MGVYSYSMHVRDVPPDRVADFLSDVLDERGFRRRLEANGGWHFLNGPPFCRCVLVTESTNGWVSVLDSDPAALLGLAPKVSRGLGAAVLWATVQDSQSWAYSLFRAGSEADAFDGEDEPPPLDGMALSPALLNSAERHWERLRSFLHPTATPEQLAAHLYGAGCFAEEQLERFLGLLGIPPIFSCVNYEDLRNDMDERPDELDVTVHRHLSFERPNGHANGSAAPLSAEERSVF